MESAIYIDNARGFKNCLVDLSRVTFLVGENSSGKSSFLAFAHLLLSDDFWINPNFNGLGHELGSFNDLVSKASRSKKEFTVGVVSKKNIEADTCFGAVVTFGEVDDAPKVKRCTYVHGDRVISYYRKGAGYKWIDYGLMEEILVNFASISLLEKLVEFHGTMKLGAGKAVSKISPGARFILLSMPHSIERELEKLYGARSEWSGDFIPTDGIGGGTWFAPIRTEPRRIYEKPSDLGYSPAGQHTPYLLRDVLRKRSGENFEKTASDMITAFGARSGLFEDLEVKSFGRSASAPFTLSVRLNKDLFNLGEVGYGVSQILPIVAEMFAGVSGVNFFMQQPEVHLHPRAQAEIANIVYIYSTEIKISLQLIETHSDFLIDRFVTLLRENYLGSASKTEAAILWFERRDGVNEAHKILIGQDGSMPDELPSGYRSFFVKETLRGLGLDADY